MKSSGSSIAQSKLKTLMKTTGATSHTRTKSGGLTKLIQNSNSKDKAAINYSGAAATKAYNSISSKINYSTQQPTAQPQNRQRITPNSEGQLAVLAAGTSIGSSASVGSSTLAPPHHHTKSTSRGNFNGEATQGAGSNDSVDRYVCRPLDSYDTLSGE